jgi:hypothetical protein
MKPKSLFQSLNSIALGALVFFVIAAIGLLLLLIARKYKNVFKTMVFKFKRFVFNLIHATFNSAILPIMVQTVFNIKGHLDSNSSKYELIGPLLILLLILAYPGIVFFYL